MFKKLILGGVVVALVAVLAVGAINRTNAIRASETGGGRGHTSLAESGGGGGRWSQNQAAPSEPAGAQGQGRGQGRGAQTETVPTNPGVGQAAASEWQTLNGVVQTVDTTSLVVKLDSGKTLDISKRAWTYALRLGFKAQPGDAVSLYGFYDGTVFEAGRIINLSTGQNVALRDANGRPLWAGRGRSG